MSPARLACRLLSLAGDLRAAQRGPEAYLRRKARSAAHRQLARLLRKARI